MEFTIPDFKADREATLPSGKRAQIRKGKGRDLMRAQKALGPNADATALIYSLVAELVRIDGNIIVYDQILEMDLADVLVLQQEVVGDNFLSLTPAPSPEPSASDSRSPS